MPPPPPPPPRLGLLQCPNAASLGWTADGPKGGRRHDGGDDEAGGAVGPAADATGTAPEAAAPEVAAQGADGDGGRAAKRARTRPAPPAADAADPPAGESTEPMKGPSPALPTIVGGGQSPPPAGKISPKHLARVPVVPLPVSTSDACTLQ